MLLDSTAEEVVLVVEAKGRWASSKTAKIYIDEARTELAKMRAGDHLKKYVSRGSRLYRSVMTD